MNSEKTKCRKWRGWSWNIIQRKKIRRKAGRKIKRSHWRKRHSRYDYFKGNTKIYALPVDTQGYCLSQENRLWGKWEVCFWNGHAPTPFSWYIYPEKGCCTVLWKYRLISRWDDIRIVCNDRKWRREEESPSDPWGLPERPGVDDCRRYHSDLPFGRQVRFV